MAWRTSTATRLVVEDHAVLQQAVMAVARVGVERDVGEDADLGHGLLDGAHGAADEVVRVQRLTPPSSRRPFCVYGNSAMPGMPSSAARSASRTA